MKKTSWICLFLALSSLCKLCAQKQSVSAKKGVKESPKFQFADPRPKFFEYSFQNLPTSSNPVSNANSVVDLSDLEESGRLFAGKLRIPLVFKGKLSLIGEAGMKNERAYIGNSLGRALENPLRLTNINFSLIGEYDLKNGNSLAFYSRAAVRADELDFGANNQYSYTASAIYQFKKVNNGQLGIGFYGSSNFGRIQVFPSILYNKVYNNRLILNAILPKEVSLTYRANDKLSYVAELSAEGSSYLITRATLDGYGALEYRRSQVGLSFGVEKLISDVAGVSLSAGVAQPINAVLVEPGKRTRDRVWTFNQNMTPFIKLSIFAVPPSKLWAKCVK